MVFRFVVLSAFVYVIVTNNRKFMTISRPAKLIYERNQLPETKVLKITSVYTQLFSVPDVGIHDNLFFRYLVNFK